MIDWSKPVMCRNGARAEVKKFLLGAVLVLVGEQKTPILVLEDGSVFDDKKLDDFDIVNKMPLNVIVALHRKDDGEFYVSGPYSETDIISDNNIVGLTHIEHFELV